MLVSLLLRRQIGRPGIRYRRMDGWEGERLEGMPQSLAWLLTGVDGWLMRRLWHTRWALDKPLNKLTIPSGSPDIGHQEYLYSNTE
jgi:hypothetical protein